MSESVPEQLAAVSAQVGLDLAAIARAIGVSAPMLASVAAGQRARIGNPAATARLRQLRELADGVTSGVIDATDVDRAVAQIAADHRPPLTAHVTGPSAGSMAGPITGLTDQSLRAARERVYQHLQPTPTLRWPLLERLVGAETWVKHENHNPTGAFKVRGGLNFVARVLAERGPDLGGHAGLISASRGNHSQSLAFAGRTHGVPVTIVVPEGNSPDKNHATSALGAEVVVHGSDFQSALEHAAVLATERNLLAVPPFHPYLVEGVATYAAELHEAVPDLDAIYVPVGMGSGACANVWVRDLLGVSTEVVGVVAERAPAYALSFAAGRVVTTPTADTFVDGVACRTPDPAAYAVIRDGVSRFVQVSEEQAAEAMALVYRCTHNLAEPAGAVALAGLLAERQAMAGTKVAIVHTGGNADFEVLARAMS